MTSPIPRPEPRLESVELAAPAGEPRLDRFVADCLPALSRSQVKRLIKDESVLVNGETAKPSSRLGEGDTVRVTLPLQDDSPHVEAEDIPLDVLYEDGHLVAINKPAGMVVHPAAGNEHGTLVNAALHRWPEIRGVGEEGRSGVVHRLDKDTSGVIVMAKTPNALALLQQQFRKRVIEKEYIALVEGVPSTTTGLIDAPIGRDPKRRKRMSVMHGGRKSATRFLVVEEFGSHALLRVKPMTGRTHQIRVHLAWLGHPIAADRVYGYRKPTIRLSDRIFLHARKLTVESPSTGEPLNFTAPLPEKLQNLLDDLRRKARGAWQEHPPQR